MTGDSFAHRFADWLHHDIIGRIKDLGDRLAHVEKELAGLKAKDGPAVEQDAKTTEAVVTEDIREAGTVVSDVEKAAGAQ